jgi:hypothetical protein
MEPIETIDYRGLKIEIFQDSDTMNPRTEFDNVGTMVCWHRGYKLGDEQPKVSPDDYARSSNNCIELPLYLLDHSGITISTKDFGDTWDSGQIGFIYVTLETAQEQQPSADVSLGWNAVLRNHPEGLTLGQWAEKILRAEVETYDMYLRGDVYGYRAGEDSCWGFFGSDHEASGLLEYARDAIDYTIAQSEKAADEYIPKIASRWVGEMYAPGTKMSLIMDLELVQTLYPAFRWKELFESAEHDFAHDLIGIRNNLNRVTKEMDNCFVPRFAR